jgi:hypothetical protein
MSCEWFIFIVGAGIVCVIELLVLLLGWIIYKFVKHRGVATFLAVVFFPFLIIFPIAGLFFAYYIGGPMCH